MAVATDKIIPGILPPKEETQGVDFLAILDSLDPTGLTDEQLQKFAPRQPSITAVGGEPRYYEVDGQTELIPRVPTGVRLDHGQLCVESYRNVLKEAVASWEAGSKAGYRKSRQALIAAIGVKVCTEYAKRQYDHMTAEELEAEQKNWERWSTYYDRMNKAEGSGNDINTDGMTEEKPADPLYRRKAPFGYTLNSDWRSRQKYIPVISLKLQFLRKLLGITQRAFAKILGYNANKYALLEQGKMDKLGFESSGFESPRKAFPARYIKAAADATHVNPYWLEDDGEETLWKVDPEKTTDDVIEARIPCSYYPMFVDDTVIQTWWKKL